MGGLPGDNDAIITSFDATGTPVFSTYFGANYPEQALGVGIDGTGNIYVSGRGNPRLPDAGPSNNRSIFALKIATGGAPGDAGSGNDSGSPGSSSGSGSGSSGSSGSSGAGPAPVADDAGAGPSATPSGSSSGCQASAGQRPASGGFAMLTLAAALMVRRRRARRP
jgi:MYXO-CTERM domain-containing protein